MRLLPLVAAVAAVGLTAGCFSSSGTDAKAGSLAKGNSLKGATVTVGGKEFTEQLVLCQITALALRSAGATVKEKCGLQGSNTTRAALTSGSIDMYWEYTGTAWINYLKNTKPLNNPTEQYQAVAQQDLGKNHVKWLAAAPANNTYAIAVKTTTMPMASTGPSPRVEFIRPKPRHKVAAETIAAEAATVGRQRRTATSMAAWRSWWRCSSSR